MTPQAKRADVLEVALTSAFDHRNDVIGIPQGFARAGAQTPVHQERCTMWSAGIAKLSSRDDGIGSTYSADATIAFKDSFTEISGLGAQFPLMHAELGTERVAAAWDFEGAPAAEAAAIGTARHGLAVDPTAFHGPGSTHRFFVNGKVLDRAMEETDGYKDGQGCFAGRDLNGSAPVTGRIREACGPRAFNCGR